MSVAKNLLTAANWLDEASTAVLELADKASDFLDVGADRLTYLAEALINPPAGEKDIDTFLSLVGLDLSDSQKAIVKAVVERVKNERAGTGNGAWARAVWEDEAKTFSTDSSGVTTVHKNKPVAEDFHQKVQEAVANLNRSLAARKA